MEVDLFVELARPPGPDGVPSSVSNVYEDLIAIAKAADQLGIGAIWLPEHHFLGDYSASSAPDMLLAAIARETTSVRLGFAILPLPIHDPVRIAERLATLDVLSGGRVMWGVGRGVTKTELDGFGVDPSNTREQFGARLAELRRYLNTGVLDRAGQRFELNPAPSPRLSEGWMAAVSPESFDLAAQLGLGVLTGPFKPWPMINVDLKRYRAAYPGGLTSFTMAAYCGLDHEQSRRRAGPGILWAYRRILDVTRTMMVQQVAGYEHYRKLGWVSPLLKGVLSLSVLETLGLACVGEPDHVAKRLRTLNQSGIDRISLVLGGGDLSVSEAIASLELMMCDVMPKVLSANTSMAPVEVTT